MSYDLEDSGNYAEFLSVTGAHEAISGECSTEDLDPLRLDSFKPEVLAGQILEKIPKLLPDATLKVSQVNLTARQ